MVTFCQERTGGAVLEISGRRSEIRGRSDSNWKVRIKIPNSAINHRPTSTGRAVTSAATNDQQAPAALSPAQPRTTNKHRPRCHQRSHERSHERSYQISADKGLGTHLRPVYQRFSAVNRTVTG